MINMLLSFFFKKVWKLFAIFMFVFIVSSLLFYAFEYLPEEERDEGGYSGPEGLADSFWYGIVTLSTVGYGDKFPVTEEGKIAALFLIIFTFTFLGAMIGTISDALTEARRREELGMDGTKIKNHIVICGWTGIGHVILKELMATKQKVVVITEKKELIPVIRELGNKRELFTVFGDSKDKEVLSRANIAKAKTVVISLAEDTKSLIVSVAVKEMNPSARIIVSILSDELKNTFYSTGITYVTSPTEMTGRLLASAAFEPEVALFVEDITSATSGHDLQQYTISKESFANGMTVKAFHEKMLSSRGPLLVALGKYRRARGKSSESPSNWNLMSNPPLDTPIKEKDIIVVLGDDGQNEGLSSSLKSAQGR